MSGDDRGNRRERSQSARLVPGRRRRRIPARTKPIRSGASSAERARFSRREGVIFRFSLRWRNGFGRWTTPALRERASSVSGILVQDNGANEANPPGSFEPVDRGRRRRISRKRSQSAEAAGRKRAKPRTPESRASADYADGSEGSEMSFVDRSSASSVLRICVNRRNQRMSFSSPAGPSSSSRRTGPRPTAADSCAIEANPAGGASRPRTGAGKVGCNDRRDLEPGLRRLHDLVTPANESRTRS
jgi:hypothetical protein